MHLQLELTLSREAGAPLTSERLIGDPERPLPSPPATDFTGAPALSAKAFPDGLAVALTVRNTLHDVDRELCGVKVFASDGGLVGLASVALAAAATAMGRPLDCGLEGLDAVAVDPEALLVWDRVAWVAAPGSKVAPPRRAAGDAAPTAATDDPLPVLPIRAPRPFTRALTSLGAVLALVLVAAATRPSLTSPTAPGRSTPVPSGPTPATSLATPAAAADAAPPATPSPVVVAPSSVAVVTSSAPREARRTRNAATAHAPSERARLRPPPPPSAPAGAGLVTAAETPAPAANAPPQETTAASRHEPRPEDAGLEANERRPPPSASASDRDRGAPAPLTSPAPSRRSPLQRARPDGLAHEEVLERLAPGSDGDHAGP